MVARTPAAPPTIVFAHANGFPAGTYRVLFDAWRAAGWRVCAVEKFGHDARFPVTSNWPHLRDQLIHSIDHEARTPSFLVGHSLGGYLSLLAASRRPDMARGVLLLDSPVLGGMAAQTIRFAKAAGLVERISPGRVSRRRRQHWPDAEAAYAHFASKPAFARWAPKVLRDYIACGVEPAGGTEPSGHGLRTTRALAHELQRGLAPLSVRAAGRGDAACTALARRNGVHRAALSTRRCTARRRHCLAALARTRSAH